MLALTHTNSPVLTPVYTDLPLRSHRRGVGGSIGGVEDIIEVIPIGVGEVGQESGSVEDDGAGKDGGEGIEGGVRRRQVGEEFRSCDRVGGKVDGSEEFDGIDRVHA